MTNTLDKDRPLSKNDVYLITGACGFIGSSVARRLHAEGYLIRIADVNPLPAPAAELCTEFLQGDLCDPTFCDAITKHVHTVLHFAANMGGMGTIHEANGPRLYRDNHTMTINLLESAVRAGVQRLLYASSACVYPAHLQGGHDDGDVQLREENVWSGNPSPQGLYGLEKLEGEMLIGQYTSQLSVRIARLHNVFGPGGSWHDGREKVPAALARKGVVLKKLATSTSSPSPSTFEIWGDGSQRRSFLYIDDCVEGLLLLLDAEYTEPVNIGSDRSIDIKSLADMALRAAGVDPSSVAFRYDTSKPIGVQSRNSHNERVQKVLGWAPRISLEEGMKRTVTWIEAELDRLLAAQDDKLDFLRRLETSTMVDLSSDTVAFAVLLPITSGGTDDPNTCLANLQKFAASLASTTWRDCRENRFRVKVYLAVDHDDEFLLDGSKAEAVLQEEGIWDITRIVCNFPRGHVCSLWRECARRAFEDKCDYFALFGDDVELLDEGWLRGIHKTFQGLSGSVTGFGCVAFTDVSFPGMPTFPVIHKIHMEIFGGEVVPSVFVNQDGDPFLFQLYRRFGSSVMAPFHLRNSIGGSDDARYTKQRLTGWTFDVLDGATSTVERWLGTKEEHGIEKKLTLDVIVPSYRVDFSTLGPILELQSSATCELMFIIIIDDPLSSGITELQQKYGARPDVRIRVNTSNLGASATRNRGLDESAAEWVFFLDDDVVPDPDIVIEAEDVIRDNPDAAGFIGTTLFPPANTVFKTAVHLAGVTYFWDVARKLNDDIPWGVTANLIARRNNDGVRYDLRFPKTGGGEDIDFCVRKRDLFVGDGKGGFKAAPDVVATHPWWHNGERRYRRFYMWAKGDGALVALFPQHCYTELAPTCAQLFLYSGTVAILGFVTTQKHLVKRGLVSFVAVFLSNVLHDTFRHLMRERTVDTRSTVVGLAWVVAVMESSIIRMVSETGRIVGQLERGEWKFVLMHRHFDWFVGRVGDGPIANERWNSRERLVLWFATTVALLVLMSKVGV